MRLEQWQVAYDARIPEPPPDSEECPDCGEPMTCEVDSDGESVWSTWRCHPCDHPTCPDCGEALPSRGAACALCAEEGEG